MSGPFMFQNILKRREDMGRDLLWHTNRVTTQMVCKAYEYVQMCKFCNFQNMTQFIVCVCISGQEILTNVSLDQGRLQGQNSPNQILVPFVLFLY